MKTITWLAACMLLTATAFAQNETTETFTVHVKIKDADENTRLYLAYQIDGKKIIDSATVGYDDFILTGKVDRPLNATLIMDRENLGVQGLMQKARSGGDVDMLPFYIHPGNVDIKTDHLIADARFSGSAINTDNARLKASLKSINDKKLNISKELRAGGYVRKGNDAPFSKTLSAAEKLRISRLTKELDSLNAAAIPVLKSFIDESPDSYIALVALEEYAGSIFKIEAVEQIYDHLSANVRATIAGKAYAKYLSGRKNLVADTPAPFFTQNDTAGKPVSLAAFKGKYVLLDFWASWCAPCRADNPGLVKLFNDFKDKNFTILGISLDASDGKQSWLKAIKEDHLAWTQVSDLKHWDNEVSKLYSIGSIPQNFLVDPNGIIVARGLNQQELRKKLEEILH